MSVSLTTLIQRVKNGLHANYKDSTTLASSMAVADTTALVALKTGERLSQADLLEVGSELMFVGEAPMLATHLNSALNATDTYGVIGNTTNIGVSSRLRIGSETLLVTAVSASNWFSATRGTFDTAAVSHDNFTSVYNLDQIRVTRGYQGTTAASASVNSAVNVVDVWSQTEITNAINNAVDYMRPYFYQDYQTQSFASAIAVNSSQTHFTATLPQYVDYIAGVKAYNNSGTFQRDIVDFSFRQGLSADVYTLEVNCTVNSGEYLYPYGAQRYAFDNSSNLAVPSYLEEFVVMYASRKLIEDRMPDILRFDRYSAKLNKEVGSKPDYTNTLSNYTNRLSDIIQHHAKPLDAQMIDFGQES